MEGLAQNETIFSKKGEEGRGDKWKDSGEKRNIYSLREKENGEGKNIDRIIFSREKKIMKKK